VTGHLRESVVNLCATVSLCAALCLVSTCTSAASAPDNPHADVSATLSSDAKAFGRAVRRDATIVGHAAKDGAHHVAAAAKEFGHEVAAAAKRGTEKPKTAMRGHKVDKSNDTPH
jgi:hypothetical protein